MLLCVVNLTIYQKIDINLSFLVEKTFSHRMDKKWLFCTKQGLFLLKLLQSYATNTPKKNLPHSLSSHACLIQFPSSKNSSKSINNWVYVEQEGSLSEVNPSKWIILLCTLPISINISKEFFVIAFFQSAKHKMPSFPR